MRWIIACSVGIGAVSLFPELPQIRWLLPLLLLVLLACKYKPIIIIGGLSFGIIWGSVYGWLGLSHQLPEEYENIDLEVTGLVVGLPKSDARRQRFDLKVKRLRLLGNDGLAPIESTNPTREQPDIDPLLRRIRVNWYYPGNKFTEVKPGETWRLIVRLKRPHGFANSGTFDYETWLFQQGIDATGYVRKSHRNLRINEAGRGRVVDQLRFYFYQKLGGQKGDILNAEVITALLIGERSDITPEQWDLFTRTGTNHLFVISGLHVGFVALCIYWLVMQLGRWVPLGAPLIAKQQVAAVCALLASTGYSTLAGFSLPTQRALIMLTLLLLGRIIKRQIPMGFCYCCALLFVLLWDPLAPRTLGFWLSFGAVGALLLGFAGYTHQQGIWWRWGRPQWVVFVAFIPLLLDFFGQFSLLSPVANIVAIPLVGLLLVPACLLSGILLLVSDAAANWTLFCADQLITWLFLLLQWLAELPHGFIRLSPSPVALVLACIGVFILLAPRGLPARWLAIFCFAPLLMREQPVQEGHYQVQVFDVGQGLSVLVETAKHRLLYDVGPSFSDNFNSASTVLLPYFRSRNIPYLDRILISHGDNDHAGSLPHLIGQIEIGDIITGASSSDNPGVDLSICESGRRWQWDGIEFQLMQAQPNYWNNENNRSCVLRVGNGKFSTLLTGDIGREAEQSLLKDFGGNLQSDLILVPHHGSRISSSSAFVAEVNPSWAVFTAGYKNRFGHPEPNVVNRYRHRGVQIFNTSQHGLIEFNSDEQDGPRIQGYRGKKLGYWYPSQ